MTGLYAAVFDDGTLKIGQSIDVAVRLAELQRQGRSKIVRTVGTRASGDIRAIWLEKWVLRRMRRYHIRGEWHIANRHSVRVARWALRVCVSRYKAEQRAIVDAYYKGLNTP